MKKDLLYDFYFLQKATSFFISFIPFLLIPFPSFLLIFVVFERNVYSFLPTYLGGTFLPLLDVSERNFFHTQCTPPAYAPAKAHHMHTSRFSIGKVPIFLSGKCRFFITDKKSASVGWIPTSHDNIGSCRGKIKHV